MTAEEHLDAKAAELDAFEHKLGLRPVRPETEGEAVRLLDLVPDAVQAMAPQEALDAAFVLRQFAIHLQRAMNREQAAARAADEGVRRVIAPKLGSMPGYSHDERRMAALRNDDAAMAYENIRIAAMLRVDRVSYLSGKVSDMARTLEAKGQRPR